MTEERDAIRSTEVTGEEVAGSDVAAEPAPEPAPRPTGEAAGQPPDAGPEEAGEARAGLAEDEAGGDERSAEELRSALDEAERAAEEYLDHLRRERADFENFRRRTTKERMEALDRGAEQLVGSLLDVLDNFGYTVQAARDSSDDQLAKGVEMVHGQLLGVLGDSGLEEVPGVGSTFDPTLHEAMLQVDAAEELDREVSDPVVVEVLRPGYRYKGRLLRPASVKVAR